MSTRTEKIGSVLHHAIQNVITRGLNDPRVRGLISVTKIEVAPDLADAQVYVSVLPAERSELTMHGLRGAAGHIQRAVAPAVAAKRMPRLHFRLDDSLKKQATLDAALRNDPSGAAHDQAASADLNIDTNESEDSRT
jgi:ribosome-binding factor A